MHIVLLNPRAQKSHRRLPLSLLFLARGIPDSVTWEIRDGNVEPDALARAEATVARDPSGTAVFVTVMPGPQLRVAVPWCRALKSRFPETTVVWGGYFPSVYPEACARDPAVDIVVIGQGEETVAEGAVTLVLCVLKKVMPLLAAKDREILGPQENLEKQEKQEKLWVG